MPSSQEMTPGRAPQARAAVNHLDGSVSLANRFSVMRHGQSKANVAGLIVSRIETDQGGDYGLSEVGRRQVLAAAGQSRLPRDTLICSSDFSRARQTAELVRACLGGGEVMIDEALRERSFGDLEGSATANYERVWAADAAGQDPFVDGVESTASVLDRATRLVADLEWRYSGLDILLVSHGDTLQILQAGFLNLDPSGHRRLPHLATGEIRRLRLGEKSRPAGR